ncbi:hypothetical protein GY45DRAFT_514092 [Cubamyces sp. BRFM 1775]|nr:hypothetical protein GY45DRAFT_514092 [Cubamyces sp. BRFM 1775]
MQQKQKDAAAPTPGAVGSAHRGAPSITLVNTNADNAAVTELSIGRLTTKPDDVTLSINWEERTTSVTLVYNSVLSRASQGATADRRNTTSVPIPRRPSSLVEAAPPTRAASPCSRGCREGGASRGQTRNPIPVPQLDLPTSPTLASAIGQALNGDRDSSTPYIPLPRRNVVQAQRAAAAARARADALSPAPQPEREEPAGERERVETPVPLAPVPAPDAAPAAASVAAEGAATPVTPARPAQDSHRSTRGAPRSVASAARKAAAAAATTTTSPTSHTIRVKAEIITNGDPNDSSSTPTKRSITLFPYKHHTKIRGTSKHTTWYGPTESHSRLPAPPQMLNPRHGHLYVHKHRAGVQMWMYVCPPPLPAAPGGAGASAVNVSAGIAVAGARSRVRTRQSAADEDVPMADASAGAAQATGHEEAEGEAGWRMVYPGDAHPDLAGYVLHLLDDGTPRWVKASSAKSYEGGRKLRNRLRRYSEC